MKESELSESNASIEIADQLATRQEVKEAFNSLTAEQFQKLVRASRAFVRFSPNKSLDYEDLLQEAVSLSLGGERRWKKSFPFINFLIGVMKSLAWNEYKSRVRRGVQCDLNEAIAVQDQDDHKSRDGWERIVAQFWNDPEAIRVLELLRFGLTRTEIQKVLGQSPGAPKYDTVMTRIRRGLSRLKDK